MRYCGELCDVSVEGDETYVASGVVVHNCRSTVISLTEDQATRTEVVPDAPPAVGFGSPPSLEWAPDLGQYDPELAHVLLTREK